MNKMVLSILYLMTLFMACNNIPDCDDPSSSQLIIQFADSAFVGSKDEIFNSIRDLESGFVYHELDTLREVSLDVNPMSNNTTYIFEGVDTIDTLVVGYRQTQFLRSEECGPVLNISDLSIIAHTFLDTLVLNNELLRDVVNIQVIR